MTQASSARRLTLVLTGLGVGLWSPWLLGFTHFHVGRKNLNSRLMPELRGQSTHTDGVAAEQPQCVCSRRRVEVLPERRKCECVGQRDVRAIRSCALW